ncbi:hypothetical protein [Arenicella xantha]|uniref:Uncharacterized protein n=1 Tax=Arenicella xantha TaxID=644221 RepID=A0A395JR80_9GAMM|nr:hypothetical protein [Arenicella xantha]RBP51210.1 hypothetical protein DFR28_102629 [Arenicella xantha]
MAKYVIRQYQFGYNDECYYISGSNILKVYDNEAEAEAAYRKLEVAHIRSAELSEQSSLWDAGDDELKPLNDFVQSKTGKHLFAGDRPEYNDSLPTELTDDEVLEFGKLADIQGYKLVTFENEPLFYAIWIFGEDEDWHKDYDEYSTSLVYSESREEIIESIGDVAYDQWYDYKIKGTLEELSDSPALLASLLENTKKMKFVEKPNKSFIKLKSEDGAALTALNELLKEPLFAIKELSLEQVLEIEEELAEESEY